MICGLYNITLSIISSQTKKQLMDFQDFVWKWHLLFFLHDDLVLQMQQSRGILHIFKLISATEYAKQKVRKEKNHNRQEKNHTIKGTSGTSDLSLDKGKLLRWVTEWFWSYLLVLFPVLSLLCKWGLLARFGAEFMKSFQQIQEGNQRGQKWRLITYYLWKNRNHESRV